jgi:membrane-associated protein
VIDGVEFLTSAWLFPVLFGLAVADAFVFLVPSELLVLAAGAARSADAWSMVGIVLVAAAGAVVGDHLSYQLGRSGGTWLRRATARLTRDRSHLVDRAQQTLLRRGGVILIGARYVPGGRTAVTFAAGAAGYSRARFAVFDIGAALLWASFYCALGYLGGAAFNNVWVGMAVGIGCAFTIAALIHAVQLVLPRYRAEPVDADDDGPQSPTQNPRPPLPNQSE